MTLESPFDRPVIILAAPRSGSTLLFESLAQSADFWTIGGESHGLFESIPRFKPISGCTDSNALSREDANSQIIKQIQFWFYKYLQDANGNSFHQRSEARPVRPRLLEKTPKNALRVSLLDAMFPDALFVYLYRNPRENISSMMDAWESGRFVTYDSLPGRANSWSLLLPPGWQNHNESTLAQTTAFQWKSANMAILSELKKLDRKRWMAVSHGQQTKDTAATLKRICEFCDVSAEGILKSLESGTTKFSRYTLTAPAENKWHKNAQALSEVIPDLKGTLQYISLCTDSLPADEFDMSIDASLLQLTESE